MSNLANICSLLVAMLLIAGGTDAHKESRVVGGRRAGKSSQGDSKIWQLPSRRRPNKIDKWVPLQVMHLNDNHARYESTDTSFNTCKNTSLCFGGFAKLQTAVNKARASFKGDTLVIHAGDQLTGTIWDAFYTLNNQQIAPQFLNKLKIDVFVPGNHEFDFGPEVLGAFLGNLTAPVVSCNVNVSTDPFLATKVRRFVIKKLPISGLKVGIIGFTPPDTATTSGGGPTVTFSDPSAVAAGCIADAKKAGAEMVLGVSHLGYQVDLTLAQSFGAFDAIIGAHSHSLLYTGELPPLLTAPPTNETFTVEGDYPTFVTNGKKKIPVFQAFWGFRYLGIFDAKFTAGKSVKVAANAAPILLGDILSTNYVKDDPGVAAKVAKLKIPLNAFMEMVIGTTAATLDGERVDVRNVETNMGNLITDALIWHIKTNTQIMKNNNLPYMAIYNGGGIRASIPAGNITRGSVVTVLPFGNTLVVKRAGAAALIEAMNGGLSQYLGNFSSGGGFAQISHANYSFDPAAPAASRLQRVLVRDAADATFELGVDYTGDVILISSDFLAGGGDGYATLAGATMVLDTSLPADQVVSDYIDSLPSNAVSEVVEGRSTNCGIHPEAPLCS